MFTLDLCTLTWITISALATLALASISFTVFIMPWFRRPKFLIEYDTGRPFTESISRSFKDRRTKIPTYWMRLGLKNTGKSVAKRCLAKLVKVMDEDGKQKSEYDPMPLHWVITSWKEVPFQTIDLNRDEREYLNVFATQSKNPELYFAGDQFPEAKYEQRAIPNSLPRGKYILGITVYGDDVKPETKYLSLIWQADDMRYVSVELHGSLRKAKSWLKKRELTSGDRQAKLDTSRHEPRNGLFGRYIMSQTLTYYIVGLILVLSYALSQAGPGRLLYGFLAVIAVLWAFGLCMVAFNCKLPKKLEWLGRITKFIERWNEPGYWFAAVIVFSVGFLKTWVDLHTEGIGTPFLYSFYAFWFILLVLNVIFVYYSRRQGARGSRTV